MPIIHVGWSWKDFDWSFPLLAHIIPYHFSHRLLKCSVGRTNRPHNIWQRKRSISESARYIVQMAGLIQCNYMLLITAWTMPSLGWTSLAKLLAYHNEFWSFILLLKCKQRCCERCENIAHMAMLCIEYLGVLTGWYHRSDHEPLCFPGLHQHNASIETAFWPLKQKKLFVCKGIRSLNSYSTFACSLFKELQK